MHLVEERHMPQSLMLQQRPGSVIAAAVLAIIYGSLFMICGLCGLVSLAAQGTINQGLFGGGDPQQAQMQKQVQEAIERDVPGLRVFQIAGTIVGLAEALALLIAGIGLLGMHSWARKLAVITALIAVASTAFQVIYQVVFVMPATTNAMKVALPAAMPKGPGPGPAPGAAQIAQMMEVMFTAINIGTVIFCVLVIAYLLVIVILLQRRPVRAAFAAWGLPAEAQMRPNREEAEDDGWRPSALPRNPEDEGRYR
jgi:hypothetical protein